MNNAEKIVEKFGGAPELARILNRDCNVQVAESTVFRWTYDKPQGTGGDIPRRYHDSIIKAGRKKGITIERSDFFDI